MDYLITGNHDQDIRKEAINRLKQAKRALLVARLKAALGMLIPTAVVMGSAFAAGYLFESHPWLTLIPAGLALSTAFSVRSD